eukprot:m.12653 g.12653  ORF g.12653 m.12653 type:complete len:468 (-) comp4323_c0_seq1:57-1460(-)
MSLHEKYRVLSKKGEGTFSEVVKCQSLKDGTFAAVKRMKGKFDSVDKVNNLREIQALRRLNPHPNIIDLMDVIYDAHSRTLDLVCELMDMNIYERIRGRKHHLPEALVKSYMYQLCKGLDHMHRNGIFHRDVKPENILLSDDVLKLADFGSCRGIYSKPPFTEYISTRWYRAPECLLTDGLYNFKMDMWSVGCVFFEVSCLYPLFPGSNELDQIAKIHDVLGTPSAELLAKIRKGAPTSMHFKFPPKRGSGLAQLMPQGSAECLDLLTGLLQYDADKRISAREALRHPYFKELRDAEKRKAKKAKQAAAAAAAASAVAADGTGRATAGAPNAVAVGVDDTANPATPASTSTVRSVQVKKKRSHRRRADNLSTVKSGTGQSLVGSTHSKAHHSDKEAKHKRTHKPRRHKQPNHSGGYLADMQSLPPIVLKSQTHIKSERYTHKVAPRQTKPRGGAHKPANAHALLPQL